jgi:hypothetical protein
VQRTRELGEIACVPYGTYTRKAALHRAFQECIRRLYIAVTERVRKRREEPMP